jgi:hypothetical protein
MPKQFPGGPPVFEPGPASHIERQILKAGLDARIEASPRRDERPRIGALPTPPPLPEGEVEMTIEDPEEDAEKNPDEEVTEHNQDGRAFITVKTPPNRE